MTQALQRELKSAPSMLSLYRRALLRKGGGKTLPALSVTMKAQRADHEKLEQYNAACGFVTGRELSPVFPHIMAFPLHMELMTSEGFPFPLLGLVHISNQITRHRAIMADELLDISCRFGSTEPHDKGTAFSVVTEVQSKGKLVWESTSTMLHRHPVQGDARKAAAAEAEDMAGAARESWKVPADMGRRYGRASGDMNPIHLYPITAKAFGFPRHIVHGMWAKARCTAALMPQIGSRPFTVAVGFKLPVFLPADVTFLHKADDAGIRFELRDRDGVKPHLRGAVKFLDR